MSFRDYPTTNYCFQLGLKSSLWPFPNNVVTLELLSRDWFIHLIYNCGVACSHLCRSESRQLELEVSQAIHSLLPSVIHLYQPFSDYLWSIIATLSPLWAFHIPFTTKGTKGQAGNRSSLTCTGWWLNWIINLQDLASSWRVSDHFWAWLCQRVRDPGSSGTYPPCLKTLEILL